MHSCSRCDYTTKRIFNLKRHISLAHHGSTQTAPNVESPHPNVDTGSPNIDTTSPNVDTTSPNIDTASPNVDTTAQLMNGLYKCRNCYKSYLYKWSLKRHTPNCKKVQSPFECDLCHTKVSSSSALCHHRKFCKGPVQSEAGIVSHITNNNQNIVHGNVNNTVNITNNIYNNVLVAPQDSTDNFDFYTGHITKNRMRSICKKSKPSIAMNCFANAVLEEPRNMCVLKTNPNVSHSKIHVGENKYEFARDKDVYPAMVFHMSTAALAKIAEYRDELCNVLSSFHKYVETVNQNEESEEFISAVEQLKLLVINMSNKILEAKQKAEFEQRLDLAHT